MVYGWKTGSRISINAQEAGEVCEVLEKTKGLTAANLVEASSPEGSPLHGYFEWDNDKAAGKYREVQAREIIRSLVIVRQEEEEKEEICRAFFVLADSEATGYESTVKIISDEDKKESLLLMAKRELEAFRKKYNQLESLSRVFHAIDEVVA